MTDADTVITGIFLAPKPQARQESASARNKRLADAYLNMESRLHSCVLMCRIAADLAVAADEVNDELSFAVTHAYEMIEALETGYREEAFPGG